MRRLGGVLAVVLAVVLALTGCSDRTGGAPERTAAPTGAADLASPIELARVVPTATADTTELTDTEGATLHVEEPFLTITRLERAMVERQQSTWGLSISLTEEDGEVFATWTGDHIGEQAAIIVDDEIVSAPTIQGAIPGGEVSIAGPYTQDEAQALLHRITGR